MKERTVVDVLQYARHDWLNKIQLLKGNLALNKIERVKAIIDEMVIDAQNETKLTNLNTPNFAELLMTFSWDVHNFTLEYEVLNEEKSLAKYDNFLSEWFYNFFTLLDELADYKGNNHLSVSIDFQEEKPKFFFDFSGILTDVERLNDWLAKTQGCDDFAVCERVIGNNEMAIVVSISEEQ